MELTMQQEQSLAVARMLVKAGVPMFLAQEDPSVPKLGHKLPFGWETNEPDVSIVDAWRPGYALCAVTGHTFDLVDIDPRSGGSEGVLGASMPQVYLTAETPSGGRHHFIRTLGVSSLDGKVAPGIDIKSGQEDGSGRGFAFIAPTVRRSKVDGQLGEYRWVLGPKGPALPTPDQLAADGTGGMLRARVMELRRSSSSGVQRTVAASVAEREWEGALRRLATDIAHWQRYGWGGAAHTGILAATTHLARLNPEQATAGFEWAFAQNSIAPDASDWQKLQSALDRAVPDVIVPDHELSPAEAFFMGGDQPPSLAPGGSLPGSALPGVSALGASLGGQVTGAGEVVRRRFGAIDEFEAQNIVPPSPIIEGVLLSGTKARISGASGAGKTWIVLDMAAHIANGKTWQEKAVTKTKVLYVAGEGAPSFGSRMATWRAAHGCATGVLLEPEAPQIASHDWLEFVDFYGDQGIGLFIFDTQGSVTIGLKENDNDHANVLHARLGALIARTGAAVLLVHHTGWEDTTRGRGASAAFGGMDTELTLAKDGDSNRVTLNDGKQRYIEQGRALKLTLATEHGGRVVRGAATTAEGFFNDDAEVRANALMARLQAHAATGQTWSPRVAATIRVLRDDLGVSGDDKILRTASRRYLASIGFTEFVNGA